jgi:hypothetical protein
VLEHVHRLVDTVAWRRHVRRIEEDQRLPRKAELDRVLGGLHLLIRMQQKNKVALPCYSFRIQDRQETA